MISTIIPIFNAEKYLGAAIDTICSQDYSPMEIIAVDDGSTDNSDKVIQKYSDIIIYKKQENRGAAAARNTGILMAKGVLLAFLDADDLWVGNKLTLQYKILETHSDIDMVFGTTEQFISPDVEAESGKNILREELKKMPGYLMGSMLIKKESFLKVGLLREDLQLAEFIDWFERAKEAGLKYKMLPDTVMRRRIHKTNQGITKRHHMKDYLKVLKASMDRKKR